MGLGLEMDIVAFGVRYGFLCSFGDSLSGEVGGGPAEDETT